jgi:hypothetical protein
MAARTRPRVPSSPREAERCAQVQDDLVRGYEPPTAPLAPGQVALATPHVPTIIWARDVERVEVFDRKAPIPNVRGVVVLYDGTRHPVADPAFAARDIRAAQAAKRGAA